MQAPYHLILISLLSVAGYLLTYSLVRAGILTKQVHRKIWNSILLVSFLLTAIPGILLAIRITYKLEWQFLEPLLVFHVDAGIALFFVAVFHLLWHSAYYLGMFRKARPSLKTATEPVDEFRDSKKLTLLILAAGFFSTAVQVLLIREITAVFQGNELMIGWTLGLWLFLTGMGTWISRNLRQTSLLKTTTRLLLLLAYIPPAIVILMNAGRNMVFLPGEMVNPFWFLFILFILLLPVCLLSGLTYSLLIKLTDPAKFNRVYSFEAIGSLAGGVAVSFLFFHWFSVFEALLVTALIIHLVVYHCRKGVSVIVSSLLVALLTILTMVFRADLTIKSFLFENQKLIDSSETASGNITVCENGGEYNFYMNGTLLFSTGDFVINEEYIHYAMLQHDHPRNVLLVSGGMTGMIHEILKYEEVEHLDYVELIPGLLKIAGKYQPLPEEKRVTIREGDGRRFIQRTDRKWDVAVFAIPDPSDIQVNRYYTDEFIRILKVHLNPGAVVLFGVSSSGNYLTREKSMIEGSVYHTLAANFRYITIIPGERDFFVASDREVSSAIGMLSSERKIPADYVNPGYMDDSSIQMRGQRITETIGGVAKLNTDRRPLPVFFQTLHFSSRFSGKSLWLMIVPVLLPFITLLMMNPVSAGMYVTGFTAMSLEMLLIFWFQVISGNLFAALGIIFALFMAGLALGSSAGCGRMVPGKHGIYGQAFFVLYLLLFPFLWKIKAGGFPDLVFWLIFIPLLLIPSFLTGFQYRAFTLNYHPDLRRSASSIYAADLWGSSLGALVITLLLLPLAGVTACCLILAGMNLLAFLVLAFVRK